jgi:hypothetical protein
MVDSIPRHSRCDHYPRMYTINRAIAIIKPKQPYLDWTRTLPDPSDVSLDELRRDCTAVLLPDVADDTEVDVYLRSIYEELFTIELAAWDTNEDDWPQARDYATFRIWFDIEVHSLILDAAKTPLRRERYEAG